MQLQNSVDIAVYTAGTRAASNGFSEAQASAASQRNPLYMSGFRDMREWLAMRAHEEASLGRLHHELAELWARL